MTLGPKQLSSSLPHSRLLAQRRSPPGAPPHMARRHLRHRLVAQRADRKALGLGAAAADQPAALPRPLRAQRADPPLRRYVAVAVAVALAQTQSAPLPGASDCVSGQDPVPTFGSPGSEPESPTAPDRTGRGSEPRPPASPATGPALPSPVAIRTTRGQSCCAGPGRWRSLPVGPAAGDCASSQRSRTPPSCTASSPTSAYPRSPHSRCQPAPRPQPESLLAAGYRPAHRACDRRIA